MSKNDKIYQITIIVPKNTQRKFEIALKAIKRTLSRSFRVSVNEITFNK